MKRFKFRNEQIEEVKELYGKLQSSIKVAEYYGCDMRTVLRFLKKHGVIIDMRISKKKPN